MKPREASVAHADLAIVGLGRIGGNLARLAIEKGLRVAGHVRTQIPQDLLALGVIALPDLSALASHLHPPRVVLIYVPAGAAVDDLLDRLAIVLEPGDVVIDGGNSYWGDSIRRARRLADHGLCLLDVGTSGGVEGARRGACFMVGGDPRAARVAEPILRRLAVDGGYVYAGGAGAGHFVKLVHNGIEFGMLQAIGEGVDLLTRYRESLPIADILESWRHGSVIRSWLVDLMAQRYRAEEGLAHVPPLVEDTGEVNWLVDDALHMEVPIPVISQAVMQLLSSRDEARYWARAIAMMRHGFGGHPYGRDPEVAGERRDGRVGGFIGSDVPPNGGRVRKSQTD